MEPQLKMVPWEMWKYSFMSVIHLPQYMMAIRERERERDLLFILSMYTICIFWSWSGMSDWGKQSTSCVRTAFRLRPGHVHTLDLKSIFAKHIFSVRCPLWEMCLRVGDWTGGGGGGGGREHRSGEEKVCERFCEWRENFEGGLDEETEVEGERREAGGRRGSASRTLAHKREINQEEEWGGQRLWRWSQ